MAVRGELHTLSDVAVRMCRMLREHPVILTPFIVLALSDFLVLFLLLFFPQLPFSGVIAPLVRNFWGERFLQYPANYLLLPSLFGYGRIVVSLLAGILCTGTAVAMIYQAEQDRVPRWGFGLRRTIRKYLPYSGVWTLSLLVTATALNLVAYVRAFLHSTSIFVALGFVVTLFIQMLFVFAGPTLIIENRKLWPAMRRSLFLFRKHLVGTLLLVLIPNLLLVPLIYLYLHIPLLVQDYSPEVVLYVLLTRILFAAVINFLIASSSTLLLLSHREQEKAQLHAV